MRAWVRGISVRAPGIDDWEALTRVLNGIEAPGDGPLTLAPPEVLSPRERRRTSASLRLCLNAAVAVCRDARLPFDAMPCVFASALGDGFVSDALMGALTKPGKPISPTQFHNSVHNAAAGYWSIGTGNMRSSLSIAAGDATFGAGLLSAMSMLSAADPEVMLVSWDMPMPEPLAQARPVSAGMSVGLVLSAAPPKAYYAAIEVTGGQGLAETAVSVPALMGLAAGTPAGRALPLLTAIAAADAGATDAVLGAGSNGFKIKVRVTR